MFFHGFSFPVNSICGFSLSVFDPAARSRTTLFPRPRPRLVPVHPEFWVTYLVYHLIAIRSQIKISDSGLGLCLACLVRTVHPYRLCSKLRVGPIGKARWMKARMHYHHLSQSDLAQQSRPGSCNPARPKQVNRTSKASYVTSHLDDFDTLKQLV